MKKIARLVAVLLCICMLFTSCTPAGQSVDSNGYTVNSQKVENLEKLCKVWGYTKYNHPAFLFGEKDWDKELKKLIPVVSEAKEEEVNNILHEWFVSLGEIDYGNSESITLPPDEKRIEQADTSWIREDYLGAELTEDLSQLGPIPNIDRSKSPVKFNQGKYPDFSNEATHMIFNYGNMSNRLLGLFRVWNAVEYYFPYLDIMDEDWGELLAEYIPKMLEGRDQKTFELTIAELTAHLQDAHVALLDQKVFLNALGKYSLPVELTQAEGKVVVQNVFGDTCPLQRGDIILKLDGVEIEQVIEERQKYLSDSDKERIVPHISSYLLWSDSQTMEVTVMRDGKEEVLSAQGYVGAFNQKKKKTAAYEMLDGNIGLINPEAFQEEKLEDIMQEYKDTDGLIIDLRQYPSNGELDYLASYLKKEPTVCSVIAFPSQSIPGVMVLEEQSYGGASEQYPSYYYEKPVVLLMNEESVSASEFHVMILRGGENVTVMGSNSHGTDGNTVFLPLPNKNVIRFTGLGVYTPEMGQTQRIGLTPDIEVHPTIEGIKEGKDELKEAAVSYIQEQNTK